MKDEVNLIHQDNLKIFLYKLGVSTAGFISPFGSARFDAASFQAAMQATLNNFGKPDTLTMNPRALNMLNRTLKK